MAGGGGSVEAAEAEIWSNVWSIFRLSGHSGQAKPSCIATEAGGAKRATK